MIKFKDFGYQYNMGMYAKCAEKSRKALADKDIDMFYFWSNAAREFKRRAMNGEYHE